MPALFNQLHPTFDMLPAALSMWGAFYVARHDRTSWRGWVLWLASNVLWICWGLFGNAAPVWGIVGQNVVFFGTSIQGFVKSRRQFAPAAPAEGSTAAHAPAEPAHAVSTAA